MDKRTIAKFLTVEAFLTANGPSSIGEIENGLDWHKDRLRRAIWKHGLPHGFSFKTAHRRYFSFLQGCWQGYNEQILTLEN